VVGFAILGGRQDLVPAPAASQQAQSTSSAGPAASTQAHHVAPTLDPNQPRSLIVRGWVARTSEAAGVMVTSRSGSTIAVSVMDPTGKPRNGMIPFETMFSLPRASIDPAEQLYVIATNARGRPLSDGHWEAVQGAVVEMVVR
jgi:hypothetical protein